MAALSPMSHSVRSKFTAKARIYRPLWTQLLAADASPLKQQQQPLEMTFCLAGCACCPSIETSRRDSRRFSTSSLGSTNVSRITESSEEVRQKMKRRMMIDTAIDSYDVASLVLMLYPLAVSLLRQIDIVVGQIFRYSALCCFTLTPFALSSTKSRGPTHPAPHPPPSQSPSLPYRSTTRPPPPVPPLWG